MSKRIALITGATNGIGLEAAVEIARAGFHTVLVGRNPARCEASVADVKARSGSQDVEALVADLSSLQEVRELARAFRARHGALHLLVNNAGAFFSDRRPTVDGLERTFALNHLAPFLLTHLLEDLLVASAPARVVTTSSGAHLGGHMAFDDLQGEKRWSGFKAYSQSKLANVLFTAELARRLEGRGVTATCLHPGVVATGFGMESGGFMSRFVKLAQVFMLSPQEGARTLVHLATSPQVEGKTGTYWQRCREKTPSKEARDPDVARRLWEVSAELVGISKSEGAGRRDIG